MNIDSSITIPDRIWSVEVGEVLDSLRSEKEQGLSDGEASRRLKKFGPNQLREHKKKNVWQILLNQIKSLIIVLLAAAAAASFLYNEILEGWAIVVVILINTAIGFFTELKAVRSMESLYKMGTVQTPVRRSGKITKVDARKLVPGDIVLFEGGDVITADVRIIESSKLQTDESALTGESMPVSKGAETVREETVLAERRSMLYKGTAVTRGAGEGVVVSTGQDTELGHISALVDEAEDEQTPLEERLDRLGIRLLVLTLLIAVFITVSGIISGKGILLMIQTGIALAVAAVPEGLPIVATIALAKGMRIMARKNALVNRLSSVETLGSTETIFTDKTGTLTENKMHVNSLEIGGETIKAETGFLGGDGNNNDVRMALEIGMLCNNATVADRYGDEETGDPLEMALLNAGKQAGIDDRELLRKYPEKREEAFDPEVKMMATWNEVDEGQYRVSVKGAPGTVLDHCDTVLKEGEPIPLTDEERERWESVNHNMAAEGLRIIGLAYRNTKTTDEDPYRELTFVGLVGLVDPPRKDVKTAIEACKKAGIRVVMLTGDQPQTARFIAQSVGLVSDDQATVIHGKDLSKPGELDSSSLDKKMLMEARIFARISPGQKLDLIEFYQRQGSIVAMTGDGVNDAPALKKADIGIAMGQRGTQVAKEASDMVLIDDAFSTIVTAIEQGRVIFSNIRHFVYYLLSCNVSEVMVVGLASLIGMPLPILPLQILFLNLVTDVFPALALGVSEGSEGVMEDPPRKPNEPILTRDHWLGIGSYGLLMTGAVISALIIGLYWMDISQNGAVTLSFLTLAFAQLWHVFNMRSKHSPIIKNTITLNPWVWGAVILCIVLILGAVYLPPFAVVMKLSAPSLLGWMIVIGLSLLPLVAGQLQKVLAVQRETA